jgi:hypothetical protein
VVLVPFGAFAAPSGLPGLRMMLRLAGGVGFTDGGGTEQRKCK